MAWRIGELDMNSKTTLAMRPPSLIAAVCGLLMLASVCMPAQAAEMRSPENQVFQFMQRDTFDDAVDDNVSPAAYLWISEKCRRLRGVLILGENVTDKSLPEATA